MSKQCDRTSGAKTMDPTTAKVYNVPAFIAKAPWYLGDVQDKDIIHQKKPEKKTNLNEWYQKGTQGPAATKFRKGACGNCGAMTHKTKDCLERPRKAGAKWTGMDIKPDEMVSQVDLDFESKRDRWNGYDPNDQTELIEEWELIEEKRKNLRQERAKERLVNGTEQGNAPSDELSDENDSDEDKYADRADAVGQHVDSKSRQTVRNLRIREDTAKYLVNLRSNQGVYNPKTRSMRQGTDGLHADEFVKYTGEVAKVYELQSFAWEAEKRGKEVHVNANPTMGELMFKQFKEKKGVANSSVKSSLIDKYGSQEHLQNSHPHVALSQSEQYVEYSSSTGKPIQSQDTTIIVRSMYEEDVFPLNHTSVWGSWWKDGEWGYKCCHSTIKSSYCAGKEGIEAAQESENLLLNRRMQAQEAQQESLTQQHLNNLKKRQGASDLSGLDPKKLKEAREKERFRQRLDLDGPTDTKYMTLEEEEAYKMEKIRPNDPMLNYKESSI